MSRAFHKTFIAGVSAVAILMTALGAGRAQAGQYDTERALAAILGLAVVGAIIVKNSKDDRKEQVVTRDRADPGLQPRPLPRRAQRDVLPEECLRVMQNGRGRDSRVFGGRCLNQSYAFADSLPRHCAQDLHGARGEGRATVWNAHCLQRNGYRISRH